VISRVPIGHFEEGEEEAAEAEFLKALELNPNDVISITKYVDYLLAVGKSKEAVQLSIQAETLDPLSIAAAITTGNALRFDRQFDLAIRKFEDILEKEPDSLWARVLLGHCYWDKGSLKEAMVIWGKMHEMTGNVELGKAFVELSIEESMKKWVEQAKGQVSSPIFADYMSLAVVHTYVGENNEALNWLEKAFDARTVDIVFLNINPTWDSLREEPRFQEIVRKMNSPENK